ncbi:MAG: DUF3445 domain-containing protein [Paracoccaceae bacterium]
MRHRDHPGLVLDFAPYTPFMEPRTARPPGLSPIDPADWTVVLPDFAAQMAYRQALLARRREIVLAELPEARPAAEELLTALLAHLATRADYRVEPRSVRRPDGGAVALGGAPLETAGRLVAEDLVLMEADAASGEYRLSAGFLCFPARWLLSEKLGRPLTAIHTPVPDYDETLARRVNRVFEAIRPGRPLCRVNWLVYATPEPHLPLGHEEKAGRPPPDACGAARLYLRTERQTLRRLPQTGAVAFGIKTSICPVEALAPATAAGLRAALSRLDPETVAYRAGGDLHARTLARLDGLAGAP